MFTQKYDDDRNGYVALLSLWLMNHGMMFLSAGRSRVALNSLIKSLCQKCITASSLGYCITYVAIFYRVVFSQPSIVSSKVWLTYCSIIYVDSKLKFKNDNIFINQTFPFLNLLFCVSRNLPQYGRGSRTFCKILKVTYYTTRCECD